MMHDDAVLALGFSRDNELLVSGEGAGLGVGPGGVGFGRQQLGR